MNRHTLFKVILIITCPILLLDVPQNSSYNSVAQAQNLTASENFLKKLSSQETRKLDRGQVVLKGAKGNYLGQVITAGNINTAWEVLTDYGNFARFLPNITASKIIQQNGDRISFEQVNVLELWLF